MIEVNIFFLIKIGDNKYMQELHQDGIIFMNDVDYFRKLEDNELRGDKDEGIIRIEQVVDIKLIHNGKLLAHGNSAQLKLHDYDKKGNIYSLMAITSLEDPDIFQVDVENKRLGDSFVIVTNVKNFMERIENKLK